MTVTFLRRCRGPGCTEKFVVGPSINPRRYCSAGCRYRHNEAMYRAAFGCCKTWYFRKRARARLTKETQTC